MKKGLPSVMLIFQIAVFSVLTIPGCKMSAGSETFLAGEAYLTVEYFWQEGDVNEPSVSAELAPYIEGGAIGPETPVGPFEFIKEGGFVFYRYEGVQDEGIYNLSMLVEENGAPLWSNDRVVSITEGTEARVSVDIFSGEVQIEIEIETVSPLSVGLSSDSEGPLTNGTDMLVTAAVSGGSPPYSFRWYLNGNPVPGETGPSLSVGSSLPPDRYRVTCIASDGVSLGSAGIVFDILSPNSPYLLSGNWFSIDPSDNFIFLPDGPEAELDPHYGSIYNLEVDFTPDDTLYNEQWNLQQLEMPAVWASVTGDPDIVVAVLDTGVNKDLPDFTGVSFVPGRNIVDGSDDTLDSIGHGTHVAGTIAQATNNAFGTAGMAFGVSIMPVKVIRNDLSSSSELITQGINWAASKGADIINLSIGDPDAVTPEGMESLQTAIQNAVSMGVTIVAAAGNNNGGVRYPAAFEEVVAVGAVDFAGKRTEYSNYGPELDIVAPGGGSPVNVVGDGLRDAILQHTVIYVPLPAVQYGNEDFWYLAGTSQATPHVSALAALLKSAHPSLSPAETRAAMENSAVDLGEPFTDPYYGKGLIDPVAALSFGIDLYENVSDFAARRIEEGSFSHCWQIHADAGIVELSLETPENEAGIGMYLYNVAGRLVSVGDSLPGSDSISFDVKLQGGVYYIVVRRD